MNINQRLWIPGYSMKWVLRLCLVGIGLGLAIAFMYVSHASSPLRQVKISEVINLPNAVGATVDTQKVEKGGSISAGQQLITPQSTRIGIQEATGAARLGSNSSLILRKDCFQLGGGKAIIASSQACIGAIVVSSTNGIYTVERLGYLAEVKVLAGQVDLSIPSNPVVGAVSLQPNQKVTVNRTGDEIGPVRLMLPQEVTAIGNGELVQGFQIALPNQNKIAFLQPFVAIREKIPAGITPSSKPITSMKSQPPIAAKQPLDNLDDSQITRASTKANDYSTNDDDSGVTNSSNASRYGRRRAITNFTDERYSSRRRWRSPYASNPYRRRAPSYSAPSYSNSNDLNAEETSASSIPHRVEQLHPVVDKDPLPMIEAPLPTAIEPSTAPIPIVPEESIVVPVQ
ncbi:MAG: hypothetical protein LH647_05750 [Leptolyngbyaceae cyanobacterium CAN_BIN12]|nr:hypothetical protein [Leptolyngbyaceae cyanobacterium CAN_BIN12]